MKQTDTLVAFTSGGSFSILAYLIGGVDNLTVALAIFMTTDYVMGFLSAIYNDRSSVDTRKMYRGLARKSGMIAFVIVANQLDIITGNDGDFVRNAMIMFLMGLEFLSIKENAQEMGIGTPKIMSDIINAIKGNADKK